MVDEISKIVIFNLDHCTPLFPLDFCRILFNKPTVFANDLFVKFISLISPESTFAWLGSPFRELFSIIFFVLFFVAVVSFLKSRLKKINLEYGEGKTLLVVLVAFLVIGFFLRIHKLNELPSGLSIDEVAIGYDALLINKTGKDHYGQSFPAPHLKSVGDYKLPIYIYLSSLSQKFIEDKIIAVRFFSVVSSILLVIATYFLGKELFGKSAGVFSAFLLSISAWQMYHSRLGIETNVGLLFSTTTILFLFLSLKRKNFLILSAASFTLAIYSHHSFWLFLPAICFVFFIIYRKFFLINKVLIISFAIVILSIIPFILEKNSAKTSRFNQTIFSKSNQFDLKTEFLNQYIRSFSLIAWYGPSAFDLVDVVPNRGLFYWFELPLLIWGIIILSILKDKKSLFLLSWLLIYPLPLLVTGNVSAARMYQLLPLPQIMESLALIYILKKNKFLIVPFFMIVFFSLSRFSFDLFSLSPFLYSRFTNYGDLAIVNFIKSKSGNEFFVEEPLFNKLYLEYFFEGLPGNSKVKDSKGVLVYKVKNINLVERGYLPGSNPRNIMISFPEDVPRNFKKVGDILLKDKSRYAVISIPNPKEVE